MCSRTDGRERAFRLANSVVTALVLITGPWSLLGIVFAEPLVRFFADDYAAVPGKLELTVYLARIMAPFLTLVALAAVFMGMLNSLGHFFIPALSPAMFNVATIVIAVALIPLAPRLGIEPIVLIAIATLVGGLGQLLIQWRPLRKEGYVYRPTLDSRDPALGRVLLLMGPGTIGMAATQINVLVNTSFATAEGTGAVSWLDYAFRMMYLPIGLFGVSIAAASTPALSRLAAQSGHAADANDHRVGDRPDAGAQHPGDARPDRAGGADRLVDLRARPVHGRDTAATARALQFYALGLVGYSVVRIVSPAFYALRSQPHSGDRQRRVRCRQRRC